MVLGALGELGSMAVRDLVRNLLPGFWERGVSANDALTELREQGLGYRRTDFLADYREGREGYDRAVSIRSVGLNNVPSERILEPLYHGVEDKYSLVFKAEGSDVNTGEEREQYFFYHRNELDTRSNMENDARDWIESEKDTYGMEVDSIRVVAGYINPVWE